MFQCCAESLFLSISLRVAVLVSGTPLVLGTEAGDWLVCDRNSAPKCKGPFICACRFLACLSTPEPSCLLQPWSGRGLVPAIFLTAPMDPASGYGTCLASVLRMAGMRPVCTWA